MDLLQKRTLVGKSVNARWGTAILTFLCLIFCLSGGQSQDIQDLPQAADDPEVKVEDLRSLTQSLWFVELKNKPLSEAGTGVKQQSYLDTLHAEKKAFRASAAQAGICFRERFAYDVLWNGLALEIDAASASGLLNLPDVADIYPIQLAEVPPWPVEEPLESIEPEMFSAVNMTGVTAAHEAGYTGSGIRIAIIDTGVDYNHPDLGGPGFPNSRIIGGYDLVGDYYDPSSSNPSPPYSAFPVPDPDPMDCNGHGTHVAGIVGADGTLRVTGVAPEAVINVYKIFGLRGYTSTDAILAALEMALADGNQVVNLSIGASRGWPRDPIGRACDNLVNEGVVVVAAAGNSPGPYGQEVLEMATPGVGGKTIGVGSVNNTQLVKDAFSIPWDQWACLPGYWCSCEDRPWISYLPYYNSPLFPRSGSEPVVYVNCACSQYLPLPVDVAGKVAVIQGFDFTGGRPCRDLEQINNLYAAGATAVLVLVRSSYADNCSPLYRSIMVGNEYPLLPLRVASIPRIFGELLNILKSTTLTWGQFVPAGSEAGFVSPFSSIGPSPDLALKPDLVAPGADIYSTFLMPDALQLWRRSQFIYYGQWYATMSGTSMAAPHVAGAAALLLEARPKTPSQKVRDILQNTSVPVLYHQSGRDLVHAQGAGLLDINAAIQTTTVVTPGKLSLGDTEGRIVTRVLEIENKSGRPMAYRLSHQPALASKPNTPPFSQRPQIVDGSATLLFGSARLEVNAKSKVNFGVTIIEPPNLPDGGIYDGYIVVTPENGDRMVRIPYLGYKGDYQRVAIFTAASRYGNPILRHNNSFGPSEPVVIDRTNGSTADDRAYFYYHLEFPVMTLRTEIIPEGGGPRSFVLVEKYVARNAAGGYFYGRYWDGTVGGSLVPSGNYFLRISAQKPLGDDHNPEHWESWTSPLITVKR